MIDNSIKIEKFIVDFIDHVIKDSDINKNEHIFNVLKNYSRNSENNIFDKKMVKVYFTNEQFDEVKFNQRELGYANNFSRFVRCALFDEFMKEHEVVFIKVVDNNKFNLLLDKCKNELLQGDYTSYDLDLLRNNEKYEEFLNTDEFNDIKENESFSFDYLEYNMLMFLSNKFEEENKYSELIGLSTKDENVDNIVPDTDSFYYLFLYCAFITNPGELDIDEIFNETDEHIEFLLKKYTFEKILRYYEQKYGIKDIDKIFDKKCIENLESDSIIELNENIKSDENTEDIDNNDIDD